MEGPCPNYGCAYEIDQDASVEIYSFNETIISESENIWTDIKTKLEQDAKTQFEGSNPGKLDAINRSLDGAAEEAIKNITTLLENASQTDLGQSQSINIEYITPIKCSDPCGISIGPKLKQNAQIIVKSEDILNSTLVIVQKRLAEHDVDVTQEVDQSNDQCIVEMILATCCCLVCMLIFWGIYKTFMDGGGSEVVSSALSKKLRDSRRRTRSR